MKAKSTTHQFTVRQTVYHYYTVQAKNAFEASELVRKASKKAKEYMHEAGEHSVWKDD